METHKDLKCTLQELANIAVGAPKLTSCNTIILHSLLNLVLKKLNCQKEKVTLSGFEAMQMEKLLKVSTVPVLNFKEQISAESLQYLDKLDDLEKRIYEMELKLNGHISEMLAESEEPQPSPPSKIRPPICKEDMFSVWDPATRDICEYLLYGDAAKQFHFHIIQPFVKASEYIDRKLQALEEELGKVLERITETNRKILYAMEEVTKDVEDLSSKLTKMHEHFLQTQQEIQDLLAAKVDKVDIADLLEYIYAKLRKLWQAVNALENMDDCKKAALTIYEHKSGSSPSTQPPSKQPQLSQYMCEDDGMEEHTLLQCIQSVDTERIKLHVEEGVKNRRRSLKLSC